VQKKRSTATVSLLLLPLLQPVLDA